MKKLLSVLTSFVLLAGGASMPVSAEEIYAPLPDQLNDKLYLVKDVDFLVDSMVAKDMEAPSYYLQSDTPKGLHVKYIKDWVPNYYLAENLGCRISLCLQDQGAANVYEDTELLALLGENYTISETHYGFHAFIETYTYGTDIWIKESPEDAKEIADAVYAWAIANHVVQEFSFAEAFLSVHEIAFDGTSYLLEDYPDAEADLTAFVADYSDDWGVATNGSYCQLCPLKDDVDHFELMDMVKTVYDALGYIPYYNFLENGGSGEAINVVYYAPSLGDVNTDGKVAISDAIMLTRYVAEDATVPITEAGLAVADLNADGDVNEEDVTELLKTLAGIA